MLAPSYPTNKHFSPGGAPGIAVKRIPKPPQLKGSAPCRFTPLKHKQLRLPFLVHP